MNRNYNRLIYIADFIVVILIIVSFATCQSVELETNTLVIENKALSLSLDSDYLEKEVIVEEKTVETSSKVTEVKKETASFQSKVDSTTTKEKEGTSKNDQEATNQTVTEKVIETLEGSLAGYGPDCAGCTSQRTASGKYIGEGNIYYQDEEYGQLRIVAGDKKYPFGTIVKITNTKYNDNAPIYAIVLDRGGSVGVGKTFLFDLLFSSEKEAASFGSKKNVTFEILRLGY